MTGLLVTSGSRLWQASGRNSGAVGAWRGSLGTAAGRHDDDGFTQEKKRKDEAIRGLYCCVHAKVRRGQSWALLADPFGPFPLPIIGS